MKEMALKPRQRPNSPPIWEMKSTQPMLGLLLYSKENDLNESICCFVPVLTCYPGQLAWRHRSWLQQYPSQKHCTTTCHLLSDKLQKLQIIYEHSYWILQEIPGFLCVSCYLAQFSSVIQFDVYPAMLDV